MKRGVTPKIKKVAQQKSLEMSTPGFLLLCRNQNYLRIKSIMINTSSFNKEGCILSLLSVRDDSYERILPY